MGMFDKDKEIGVILQNWIAPNTPFIIWGARILREDFPTQIGNATQSGLRVSKVDTPGDRYDVTTLASGIAAKVREAEPTDFPAIVQTIYVNSKFGNDALVLQFLKPYDGANSRGSATRQATAAADTPPQSAPQSAPAEQSDIPFADDIPF